MPFERGTTIHREAARAKVKRVISSVGLEHYLDRVGVTGSNPVLPTKGRRRPVERINIGSRW